MAIGALHRIKIHEDTNGVVVLDSFERIPFTHVGTPSTQTTVKKEDFTGTTNDAYVVEIAYASGNEPNMTTLTTGTLRTTACTAVNTKYGAGEVDPSAT